MRCVVSNLFLESMGRFSVAVRLSDSRFFFEEKSFRGLFRIGERNLHGWIFRLPGGLN